LERFYYQVTILERAQSGLASTCPKWDDLAPLTLASQKYKI
jgi:hypothetical protein